MNTQPQSSQSRPASFSRRRLLKNAAFAAAGVAATHHLREADAAGESTVIKNGNIRQSIVQWCFDPYWSFEEMAKIAKRLGCQSIELSAPKDWPILKKYNLTCAIATIDMSPDPPFVKGFNNPTYWPQVMKVTREAIDAAADFGVPNVICFTGMSEDIPDDVGLKNSVAGLKKIIGHAERKKVDLCLEMLNTRDRSHPMKGHPGYQGNHTDYCIELIKQVGSPRMKLLFDLYHVQIMDGDIIRRIREYKDYIGHIHAAGNPGRGELDDNQEINFPAIMRALVDVGYAGFVGHEFIPTRDPLKGLTEAVTLCDV